ncbi:UNVERIFIED_CONTAM: hypothetical protein Slati_0880200 [Sesamum latifolium]|uniref:Reverse transcriptase zinc-binding domain-containing protein n=1 Tax=Sesamum latifolium TaxID=2727402 RepID=A0AAW2XMY9_9LAMI
MEIVDHLPRLEDSDGVRWNSTTGEFTISDAYRLFQPPGPTVGWHVLLRGPLRIPRNCFILWLAILERLSTLDRTWWTGLDSTCVLCSRGETESHSHLFFQCEYARTCLRILEAEVRFRLPRLVGNTPSYGRLGDGEVNTRGMPFPCTACLVGLSHLDGTKQAKIWE